MLSKIRKFNLFPLVPLIGTFCVSTIFLLASCGSQSVKLDPKNPVSVTVWHYYNGTVMDAFDSIIETFNATIGKEKGVIVEGIQMGNTTDIEKSVLASANNEVGSEALPTIFLAYADTALALDKLGVLANIGDYLTDEEIAAFVPSFIDEGRIGDGLKIFPVAKSTETLMLNETDWQAFADATGATVKDLATMESLAACAKDYYEWSDALTPDTAHDGKALFGRDAVANLFVTGTKSLGQPIFDLNDDGSGKITLDPDIMRKFWDYYYVPYISGYFTSAGKFRSDDMKTGLLIAYVGSTASASYFPTEVTDSEGNTHDISPLVLAAPQFDGAKKMIVQQGAGMAVTKGTPQSELAAVEFIRYFTQETINIEFAGLSGYLPVRTDALSYDTIKSTLDAAGVPMDAITDATIKSISSQLADSEFYTYKPFDGGVDARGVVETNLMQKCVADRESVVSELSAGTSLEDAVAKYNTDEAFNAWLADFEAILKAEVK